MNFIGIKNISEKYRFAKHILGYTFSLFIIGFSLNIFHWIKLTNSFYLFYSDLLTLILKLQSPVISFPFGDILSSQITIFILFFTLVQFAYTSNYITFEINLKYILKHDRSVFIISYNFAFILLLGVFSVFGSNEIGVLSAILIVIFLILSVTIMISHFYWLSKIIIPSNLFMLILNQFDENKASKIEERKKENEQSEELVNDDKDEFDFFYLDFVKTIRIKFPVSGYLIKIDSSKINEYESKNNCKISFNSDLGDYIESGITYLKIRLNSQDDQTEKTLEELSEDFSKKISVFFEFMKLDISPNEMVNGIVELHDFNKKNPYLWSKFSQSLSKHLHEITNKNDNQIINRFFTSLLSAYGEHFRKEQSLELNDEFLQVFYSARILAIKRLDIKIYQRIVETFQVVFYAYVYSMENTTVRYSRLTILLLLKASLKTVSIKNRKNR